MTADDLKRMRAGPAGAGMRRHCITAAASMRAADTPEDNPANDHEVTHARHH